RELREHVKSDDHQPSLRLERECGLRKPERIRVDQRGRPAALDPDHDAIHVLAHDWGSRALLSSPNFIRGASPLRLPRTPSRSPVRWLAPFAWLARAARSHVAASNLTAHATPAFLITASVVSSPSLAASSAGIAAGMRPSGSGLTPSMYPTCFNAWKNPIR